MEQVQTLTVLENSTDHLDIKSDVLKNLLGVKKRIVDQDLNNNNESVGKKVDNDPLLEEPQETSLLGFTFNAKIKWRNTLSISLLHIAFIISGLYYIWHRPFSLTSLWGLFVGGLAGFGVTAGAHRYWCHRAFKATTPGKIILMLAYMCAGQNTLYDWVRDHRVHHKYSETIADPHNANRGFFFAHVGWLMLHKHPEVIKKGRVIDMTDILADPVVQFQQKYFAPLKIMFCFILPTLVPVYFWNETWFFAIISQCIIRYTSSLNFTWSVNSAAHMFGTKPYDEKIMPTENRLVALFAMGEGWHNYHHVFPWDWKAAELGNFGLNVTTMYLTLMHKLGLIYDLREPSKELVKRTIINHGDGTHPVHGKQANDQSVGYPGEPNTGY